MRWRIWAPAGVVVLAAVATAGVAAGAGAGQAAPAARDTPASTATVERGRLSALVAQDGILTYRARSDGSPYPVINQAAGVYTALPETGDEIGCGGVLYRVDDRPVLLLCGAVPAYRGLRLGDTGADVRQLNANLHRLGRDAGAAIDPADGRFTWRTRTALGKLQRARGIAATGTLAAGAAVFVPEPVRIAKVTGEPGGQARPGAAVLAATSGELHVQVALEPSDQGQVRKGDRAVVTLPGNVQVPGKVEAFGRVAQAEGPQGEPADATVPTFVTLDDPAGAQGFDNAPVHVEISTEGVEDALSVPVTALVGRSGGGFAVEVVRGGGTRALVAVRPGLFDATGGRVQVEGELRAGDDVVVPAS